VSLKLNNKSTNYLNSGLSKMEASIHRRKLCSLLYSSQDHTLELEPLKLLSHIKSFLQFLKIWLLHYRRPEHHLSVLSMLNIKYLTINKMQTWNLILLHCIFFMKKWKENSLSIIIISIAWMLHRLFYTGLNSSWKR
jgi:hypothetical protein